ncbi:MAG: glycosyltransferase [Candidatus Omnitrophica bacterium]|nr:glycosyltransferase [Candidatus Omnitrophota bacterium]
MKTLIKILDILGFLFFGAVFACPIICAAIISSCITRRRRAGNGVRELSFAVFDLISNKYPSMLEDALLDGYLDRHYYIYLDFSHSNDRFENIGDDIFFYSIAAHPGNCIYKAGFHKVSMLITEARALLRGYLLALRNDIDLIKAHDPHLLGLNGLIISRLLGLPCVLHLNSDFDMKYRGTGKISSPILISRGVERLFESTIMRFYDLIVADRKFYSRSRHFSRDSIKKYRAFGVRVDRLHYADPASRTDLRASLGLDGARIILYVGRLHPVKYPEDAVKAFSIIKKSVPNAYLLIAGAGVLRDTLERMAGEYGLKDSVRFLGQKKYEELVDLLYTADVLLAPHGGVTLVEAALASTPAVTYDFDWHSEFLKDGEMGYIAPFRDFKSMAQRAIDILTDEAVRVRMSELCRKVAVSGCSRERSMENEKKIYRELIGA